MEISAISFSEQIKNIIPIDSNSAGEIFSKLPKPVPIDEITILDTEKEKQQKKVVKKEKESFSFLKLLWITLAIIGGIALLIFSLPWLIYRWFRFKAMQAGTSKQKAYWSYTSAMYLLNQLGFVRNDLSPLQFAKQDIDPRFNTNFSSFIQVYLKTKYSTQPLTSFEENIIKSFYSPFDRELKHQIPFKQRFNKFLNFYSTINYFTKPKV
jgi:hypothetical protein